MKQMYLIFFLMIFQNLFSSIITYDSHGNKILLKEDKTWEYVYNMQKIDAYVEDKDIRGEYIGEEKDGKAHGYGRSIGIDIYEGDFVNGKIEGYGNYIWQQPEYKGDVYEGNFKEGHMHGQGTIYFANGEIYSGEWKNSVMEGNGKFLFSNGIMYEGEFKNNIFDGKGKITVEGKLVYEDEFKEGAPLNQKAYENFLKNVYSYKRKKSLEFLNNIEIIKNNIKNIKISNENVMLVYKFLNYNKEIEEKKAEDIILKLELANNFLDELEFIYNDYKELENKKTLTED